MHVLPLGGEASVSFADTSAGVCVQVSETLPQTTGLLRMYMRPKPVL